MQPAGRGWSDVEQGQGRRTRLYRAPVACPPVASGTISGVRAADRDNFRHVAGIIPFCYCKAADRDNIVVLSGGGKQNPYWRGQ